MDDKSNSESKKITKKDLLLRNYNEMNKKLKERYDRVGEENSEYSRGIRTAFLIAMEINANVHHIPNSAETYNIDGMDENYVHEEIIS